MHHGSADNDEWTELIALARALLERAARRESLDAGAVRRLAQRFLERDPLGSLALGALRGGPNAARHVVELAGALIGRDVARRHHALAVDADDVDLD